MPNEMITLGRSVTYSRGVLEEFAVRRGYQEKVYKSPEEMPERTNPETGEVIPYSIEESLKPNPQSKIDWLQDWFDDQVVKMFSADIEQIVRSQAEAQIQATIEAQKVDVAAGITRI